MSEEQISHFLDLVSLQSANSRTQKLLLERIYRRQTLGLIRIDQNRAMTSTGEADSQMVNDMPSTAVRKYHEQMAQKAVITLSEQTFDEGEFQGIQIAFNRANLQKAKLLIRNFIEQFEAEFRLQTGEDVYQLNLQFFNLTKK